MTRQAEVNVRDGNGTDPADVATVIAKAVQARRPRTRYLVGCVVARNIGLRKPTAPAAPSQAPGQKAGLATS